MVEFLSKTFKRRIQQSCGVCLKPTEDGVTFRTLFILSPQSRSQVLADEEGIGGDRLC